MHAFFDRLIGFLRPVGERYRILITAWILNIPLMALVFLKNLQQVDYNPLTFFYAQTVIGYYALPLLVIVTALALVLFPFRRTSFVLAGAAMGLFVYYLFLDSLVYAVTRVHIDFFWLEFLLKDFSGLGFPGSTVAAAIAVLFLSFGLQVGIYKLARRRPLGWPKLVVLQVVVVLAFGLSQFLHIVAYKQNDHRITSLTPHYPLYVPFTSHSNADKYGEYLPMFDIGEASAAEQSGYRSLNYPRRPMRYADGAAADSPNLLVVFLESWRYDQMNETVSPHIAELAARSTVFENHLSSGNQTTCGLFGFFYGLHATYWSAVKANNALIDNPVLIDRLEQLGYEFGIYADSNFERHKVKDTMFAGIDVHEEFGGKFVQDKDADMSRQVQEFISDNAAADRPWMAFAFFKASHYSYYYPKSHRVFLPAKDLRLGFTGGDTEPEKYLNDYMNSVHYNDELVGDIVVHLEETGQMDNTVIVLTTDHGEEFNDNGANYWGHGSNFSRYQTQVPLVVYMPGREPARITTQTGHVDVAPTLLAECYGCLNEMGDYSSGRSLFDDDAAVRPFVIGSYFNHAFVIGDDVYDVSPTGTKKHKLQDVTADGDRPDPAQLKRVLDEINSFYADESDLAAR